MSLPYLVPVGMMYVPPIPPDVIRARCGDKALDVEDRAVNEGANVQQWGYGGGWNQQWRLEDAGAPMIVGAAAERPVELALRLLDRQVIDAGEAPLHQAEFVELPVLVAVAAPPLAVVVVPFVFEAHGDAIARDSLEAFEHLAIAEREALEAGEDHGRLLLLGDGVEAEEAAEGEEASPEPARPRVTAAEKKTFTGSSAARAPSRWAATSLRETGASNCT